MLKSFDAKLPDYTGSVGFVIANTFIGMQTSSPSAYPLDLIRINLLLYAVQQEAYQRRWKPLFHEPFTVLSLNKQLTPCLISVLSLYGMNDPCLIANSAGNAVFIDMSNKQTPATQLIDCIWDRYKAKSNAAILEDLKAKDFVLKGSVSGSTIMKV